MVKVFTPRGRKANPLVLIIIGFVFTIVGIAVVLFFACKTTLVCERSATPQQGTCILTHAKLIGTNKQQIIISDLQKARVDEHWDDDGSTYSVVLETSKGEIKLTPFSSSGRTKKDQMASQVNSFINNKTQKNMLLEQDDRWFGFLLGGIFFVVGLGVLLGGVASILSLL